MNFTTIWEKISPYINVATLAAIVSATIGVLVKILFVTKQVKKNSEDLTKHVKNIFVEAIPKEMTISVKTLAQKELINLFEKVIPIINEANEKNSLLINDIAMALYTTSRTMPTDIRERLRMHLEEPTLKQEKLTIEMNADFEELTLERLNKNSDDTKCKKNESLGFLD